MKQKHQQRTSFNPQVWKNVAEPQHSLRARTTVNEGSDHLPDSGRRLEEEPQPLWWALLHGGGGSHSLHNRVTTCRWTALQAQNLELWGGGGSLSSFHNPHRWGNLRPRRWSHQCEVRNPRPSAPCPGLCRAHPCPLPLTRFSPADLDLQHAAEPAASFPSRAQLESTTPWPPGYRAHSSPRFLPHHTQ